MISFTAREGNKVSALLASDYVNAKSLAASVSETETVPAGASFVIISANADIYLKKGGAASVPGDVADGTASFLNPYAMAVGPGDTYGVISAVACIVTFSYYGPGS